MDCFMVCWKVADVLDFSMVLKISSRVPPGFAATLFQTFSFKCAVCSCCRSFKQQSQKASA